MKKSRFTEEQIAFALQQAGHGPSSFCLANSTPTSLTLTGRLKNMPTTPLWRLASRVSSSWGLSGYTCCRNEPPVTTGGFDP